MVVRYHRPMAAMAPRIKLNFEGSLGQHLVEHNLQKCWCAQQTFAFKISPSHHTPTLILYSSCWHNTLALCRYQLPAVTSRGSNMQTVSDLITQVGPALHCNSKQQHNAPSTQLPPSARSSTLLLLAAKPVLQIRKGFSLLEHIPDMHLELDGYTILEGTSLDLFRDGDIVTVKASQAVLALRQPESAGKRRRSEACMPTTAAGKC